MKKIIVFYLCFLCFVKANSQNLIVNGGFDTNNGCPNQIGQVDKADGWSVWGGTPDYFHSCSNVSNPIFGTPVNNRGFQVPHSGSAYMGIFTFTIFTPNGREFIGRQLAAPMVIGQTYHVSFWVNHADVAVISHSTNNIGVRFATSAHTLVDPDTALNNAHVFASAVISDTANWVQISGIFVADSAYTHIGIGNYFSDAASIIVPGAATSNYAYYLIDDVCVSVNAAECGLQSGINAVHDEIEMSVYPNPATEIINIKTQNKFKGTIKILNALGVEVFTNELYLPMNSTYNVNVSSFAKGIYFIKFFGEETYLNRKIVLQ